MQRRRAVALAGLVLAGIVLAGCATAREVTTRPTGKITIERQEFLNTYAVVKVLYRRMYAQLEAACDAGQAPPATCASLPGLHQQVRALDVQIQAKIEVPESEIDWAVVVKMLGALVSLVP